MSRIISVVVCLLLASSTVFGQPPKKYALLAAVTTYEHTHLNSPPKIQYPEADAKAIADVLQASGYRVDLLLGEQATHKAVADALAGLAMQGNQTGVIVVGFFGHGVEYDEKGSDGKPTSRSYFCPYDASMRKRLDDRGNEGFVAPGKPRIEPDPKTLISMSEVFEAMSLSPAGNRVLLADCCRNDPHAARGRGFGTGIKSGDLPEHANTAALLACSKGEKAFEDPTSKHGAFTKCVLDWLKNPDGRATAGNLGQHLELAVPQLVKELSNGEQDQKPRYLTINTVDLQLSVAKRSTPQTTTKPETTKPPATSSTTKDGFAGRNAGDAKELSPGFIFHWCPEGKFTMGSPKSETGYGNKRNDHEDQVEVRFSQGFWLGETEVTQDQWTKLMGTSPWKGQRNVKEGSTYAASYISHDDAVAFVKELTDQERSAGRLPAGWRYALPTEAQWEYACRAGTTTKYGFGSSESELGTYAWFDKGKQDAGEKYAHEVGKKKPNNWGLKDMHGNVYEWCSDWYGDKLPGGIDPVGASSGSNRVYRGGSFGNFAVGCRSAFRNRVSPDDHRYPSFLGFRVATVPSAE